jgi:hypothetical protein
MCQAVRDVLAITSPRIAYLAGRHRPRFDRQPSLRSRPTESHKYSAADSRPSLAPWNEPLPNGIIRPSVMLRCSRFTSPIECGSVPTCRHQFGHNELSARIRLSPVLSHRYADSPVPLPIPGNRDYRYVGSSIKEREAGAETRK